jgi:cytoskeletal protein CcmA (bactofilin family)
MRNEKFQELDYKTIEHIPMATVAAKPSTPAYTPSSNGDNSSSCVIAPGTKIEGNFQSAENVRLDGAVIGEFSCEKKLVVGKDGRVEGNIHARDAVVMGTVIGDLFISGLLQLDKTAVINGNITTVAISVEEGARYDGRCKVGK